MKTKWIAFVLAVSMLFETQGEVVQHPEADAAVSTAATQPRAQLNEEIEILPGGAIARFGPHQVSFAADAKTPGAIALRMPSGEWLRSTVFGLAYFSPDWKRSALIAELKSTEGELLSGNRVLYRNAFEGDGVEGDILYTYTRESLEQDIIIRKRIPAPEEYDLPHDCRLVVMTEFIECPPFRRVSRMVDLREHNFHWGVAGEEAMQDETLIFGDSMRMVAGKAFILGQAGLDIPVAKCWEKFDGSGSWFLVESTPYPLLQAQLDALPHATLQRPTRGQMADVRNAVRRQENRVAMNVSTNVIHLAKANINATPGVVLDYLILNEPVEPEATGDPQAGQTLSDVTQSSSGGYAAHRVPNLIGTVESRNPLLRRKIADTGDVIKFRVFTPLK